MLLECNAKSGVLKHSRKDNRITFLHSPQPTPPTRQQWQLHHLHQSPSFPPQFSYPIKTLLPQTSVSSNPIPTLDSEPPPPPSTPSSPLSQSSPSKEPRSAPPLSTSSPPTSDTARSVVHRGITTDLTNRRRGTASTLTRAEVRGGGRKPYPQKKTGGARRGSQRTPLRPGGGVIFGPKPKDWSVKMNKKEKRLALSTAISSAAENTFVVEDFDDKFEKPKTKEFIAMLNRLGLDPKKKATFLMTQVSDNVRLSARNLGTLKMLTPRTLNLFDILDAENLVLTKGALEFLNDRYGLEDDEIYEEEGDFEEEEEEGTEVEEAPESSE
ncbi:hypothetical protein MIMGU_mgv1a009997mg [Erythranthe guttata]|uniref:Large ribosomal subunit protein uL4c n=1 Tax=Erythranthe guttata TaxID=4155 RepID=A0A022RE58_ERYGU|nr:hypothetical protein MIMGU_mgv1a009997mg [Erythranthe guttata]